MIDPHITRTSPSRELTNIEHRTRYLERALAAEPHGSRAQMNAEIPEEEREAAEEAAHLDEIGDYLNSAAAVVGVDLVELERPPEIRETMLRETARAGVHRFENSADTGGASGDASGDAA